MPEADLLSTQGIICWKTLKTTNPREMNQMKRKLIDKMVARKARQEINEAWIIGLTIGIAVGFFVMYILTSIFC